MKPLHKTGLKHMISNYRPISLTSTCCKLLEHIIHNHISEFLETHSVLTNFQHGFRKGYSTCTQLVQTVHDFAISINNGNQTDAIFMDFSKAFDKVSHQKLLFKLDKIFRNNQLLKWILAYLSDREQFVNFKNSSSCRLTVSSGVPQGSVLGPILFLVYINDIVDNIPVKMKLFADDCVIYSEISSMSDQFLLNDALQKVITWCDQWQMAVNFDKTVVMRITQKKNPFIFNYSVNAITLREVTQYKYLGLWITNNLNWNKHIDFVIAAANRKLFFLRRALKLSTPNVRLLAYKSVVRPALEYCVVIWDPYTKTNISRLENVQKKAARYIFNKFRRTSVTELLRRADLPSLAHRNLLS